MKPIIEIQNLSKKYKLGSSVNTYGTIRDLFKRKKQDDQFQIIQALNNISLEIQEGETVGIIGRNGSGKSTLLKILSQITYPDNGKIILRGRVGSLLEVGTGFHGELTGRENIYFNGSLLGLKRHEIKAKFDEIVEFSDVANFIDTPLKHYSSGMQLRLAFSVASHLEPEILAVDEVLAVGDAEFQKKSLGKMSDVAKNGRTILFVSHNMGVISTLCKKVLILNKGNFVDFGDAKPMIEKYLSMLESMDGNTWEITPNNDLPVQVVSARMVDIKNTTQSEFCFTSEFKLALRININQRVKNSKIAIIIFNQLKEKVFTILKNCEDFNPSNHEFIVKLPHKLLAPGNYSVGFETFAHLDRFYQTIDHALSFSIIDDGTIFSLNSYGNYGNIIVECEWN